MSALRNMPCYCGSGKKFKNCHGYRGYKSRKPSRQSIQPVPQSTSVSTYRPIISAEHLGHRFVAVGNQLMSSQEWNTFPDFLFDYIRIKFGVEWGQAELRKPSSNRSTVVQWYVHTCELQKLQVRESSGLYAMQADGIATAYLSLAYDLYILDQHQLLQERLIERLKNQRNFQGARYELFVAATLVRAGFKIMLEDESDCTTKHPELIAIHRKSNFEVDVEAKSRHRAGVLGHPNEIEKEETNKFGFHRLLNRALEKARSRPLLIFVDLNLPSEKFCPLAENCLTTLRAEVERCVIERDGKWPFWLAIATNCPHHYGQFNEDKPIHAGYIAQPEVVDNHIQSEISREIELALKDYGNVPNFFPGLTQNE